MEDFATTTVGKGLTVTHGTDQNLLVEFYRNPANGKAYIKINFPGDKTTEIRRPVGEEDKVRFPIHWAAYENGQKQIQPGHTPLEDWPALSEAQRSEFKLMNVHSVEQMASIGDATKLGFGGQSWVEKAKAFVASKVPANEKLAQENAAMKAELAELRAMIMAQNSNVESIKPKRKYTKRAKPDELPPAA